MCFNPTVEIIMNYYPLTVFVIIKEQLFRSRNIVLSFAMLYYILYYYCTEVYMSLWPSPNFRSILYAQHVRLPQ